MKHPVGPNVVRRTAGRGALVVFGLSRMVAAQSAPSGDAAPRVADSAGTVDDRAVEKSAAEGSAAPSDAPEPAPSAPLVTPPTVLEEAPVTYPGAETASGEVSLIVVVDEAGAAREVTVERGVSPGIDRAVVDAVRRWKFSPARRGEEALAARVRVVVSVAPPVLTEVRATKASRDEPSGGTGSKQVAPERAEAARHADQDDTHLEITVHGERAERRVRRSASDYALHRELLVAAPHEEGADVLRVVPGLTSFRTEGLASAHSYSLRGFDSEHGQDIEFVVGGLPINLPSHIHGQGYSDLGFLIGDVVDELVVNEGVSDPRQGDFAVAGTIRASLGMDEEHRGLSLRGGYGSFATPRAVAIWAPKEAARESFGAAQFTSTGGYGDNRDGTSASGLLQHRFGEGSVTYRVIGLVHGARAASAGVLRQDDIDSGRVCYHCVYPYPTAEAQSTLAQRFLSGFFADYRGPEHASGNVGVYVGYDHYRSQANYTGFLETSRELPGVSGRGDLIEQTNDTTTFGLTGRYRTEAFEAGKIGHGTLEVGLDGRVDAIGQSQNLLDATVRNQTWDERVDAGITAVDTALFGDLDWEFSELVQLRLGLRGAVLSYDVNDRLGNFAPLTRPQDQYLDGYRRSALGVAVGPRTSLEVRPLSWLRLLASYGEGYRSPQARTLEDGESAPFAKVRSADVGARFLLGNPLELSVSGYYTHLSDDVAFHASEGRMESIGATRRMGAAAHAVLRPTDWLLGSFSATYVNTAMLEPPPPTAAEPEPPFSEGQPIPYVSPLVLRLDASALRTLVAKAGPYPLRGRAGLGFTFIAPRPLPYGASGQPIPLLDASLGILWGPFDLTASGFNLLDLDYAAREYSFVSNWDPSAPPSRIPARHIAAGSPLSVFVALGVQL